MNPVINIEQRSGITVGCVGCGGIGHGTELQRMGAFTVGFHFETKGIGPSE